MNDYFKYTTEELRNILIDYFNLNDNAFNELKEKFPQADINITGYKFSIKLHNPEEEAKLLLINDERFMSVEQYLSARFTSSSLRMINLRLRLYVDILNGEK